MNLAQKRPYPSPEGRYTDIMDTPQPKRARPSLDMSLLTPADREALERVASMLQRPVSELWEGGSKNIGNSKGTLDITSPRDTGSPWPIPATRWEVTSTSQNFLGNHGMGGYTSISPTPWNRFPVAGRVEEARDDPTYSQQGENLTETPHIQTEDQVYAGDFVNFENPDSGYRGDWTEEIWPDAIPELRNSSAQNEFRNGVNDASDVSAPLNITEFNPNIIDDGAGTHGNSNSLRPPPARPSPTANDRVFISSNDESLIDSDEDGSNFEADSWEDVQPSQPLDATDRLSSSTDSNGSSWSLIEMPREQDSFKTSPFSTSKSNFEWIQGEEVPKDSISRQPRRRGAFQDKQLQEQTSETRKRKACVRCRMQKTRCLMNPSDPDGVCLTCQAVSKQKIHTLPCLRYKITECTLYRTGKAPGMEFTLRWPVMKLKDISEWAEPEVRSISIKSDMCPVPLNLSVRKFVPTPQDSLHKGWMDGKVKKFKEVTPFAIVNMTAALKDMREHINTHVFECMAAFIDGRDILIQETYAFARKYMTIAPEDEQRLLANFFRLWFAIRRTATTEFIVSEDTIDMTPETKDPSYPLFRKIPLPPVMIHQLDMIITLGLLQPLRKKVLEDFHKIIVSNKPKSWMTIYLITFMFLHRSATLSAENYQNARKHGLRRRYAIPTFISELHHGSNVFLSHYHYCTKPCDPFTMDWRKRQSTPFAEMSIDEIHFLVRTSKLVKERKEQFRVAKEIDLYEDDLYFISQMFEENWVPRDTVIDFTEGTVADVPLRRFYSPK